MNTQSSQQILRRLDVSLRAQLEELSCSQNLQQMLTLGKGTDHYTFVIFQQRLCHTASKHVAAITPNPKHAHLVNEYLDVDSRLQTPF